jgi:hypothetical protein
MKTRTLLLLSVGTALAILIAGGVLLFQLSSEQEAIEPSAVGEQVTVGDLAITVTSARDTGDFFEVDVVLGGVDDGLDSIRLVTSEGAIEPVSVEADGRCVAVTVDAQSCRLDFGLDGITSSSRTLVVRRGDQQANWNLGS